MTERRHFVTGWPLAAVLAVIALLLYMIRVALLPFALAAAAGFVLDPVIRRLQPHTFGRRGAAAGLVFLLLLIVIFGAGYMAGRTLVADIGQVAADGLKMLHRLIAYVVGPQGTELFGQKVTADSLSKELENGLRSAIGLGVVARVASLAVAAIAGGFLTLVLIAYFLVSGPRLARGAIRLIPPERRGAVESMLPHLIPVLRRYLVGVVVVVCCTATAAWLGYGLAFHLPHAVLLSITVGLLEMIPALGPMMSGALVGLAALTEHSLLVAGLLILYAVALRLGVDNVLGPLVMGKAVKVHPVVIIFSFIAGGILFGILGLLLAVPVAACLRIVLQVYYAEPIAVRSRPAVEQR